MQNNKTCVIAEIGQMHDGSYGILRTMVEQAAQIGVDAVKFQMHFAEAESSHSEEFRINFSYVDKSRFDYWKRMELSYDQWKDLKCLCDQLKVEFLVTPFSLFAVDLLETLNVQRYKIGSGDTSNYLLLEKICKTNKEIIISTGMSDLDELDSLNDFLQKRKASYALMHCTTEYPTSPQNIGLDWIQKLKIRYGCPVGFSDHSGSIYAGLGAVVLGAEILESHITYDKRMFGPDAKASLTIDQFKELIEGTRYLEFARENPALKKIDEKKLFTKNVFSRSISINKNMLKGEVISFNDLESKKPGGKGISPLNFEGILNKRLTRDVCAGEFLTEKDIL
jgi:N-acetylneuraminate synthase